MRLKQGYKEQNGCHNCARAFIKREWEDDDAFFCTFKHKGTRPLCGSALMDETFYTRTPKENPAGWYRRRKQERRPVKVADRMARRWDKWAKARKVAPWGICTAWRQRIAKGE